MRICAAMIHVTQLLRFEVMRGPARLQHGSDQPPIELRKALPCAKINIRNIDGNIAPLLACIRRCGSAELGCEYCNSDKNILHRWSPGSVSIADAGERESQTNDGADGRKALPSLSTAVPSLQQPGEKGAGGFRRRWGGPDEKLISS
jgi:hypothetical protein